MNPQEIEQIVASRASDYLRRNGVRSLRLFGSRLHGTATDASDIDLLVEFDTNRHVGLFELSRIEITISDLLGSKVDLRTANELSRYFRARVLSESRLIHGESRSAVEQYYSPAAHA
jgi:predicted nucleotidyltransferase